MPISNVFNRIRTLDNGTRDFIWLWAHQFRLCGTIHGFEVSNIITIIIDESGFRFPCAFVYWSLQFEDPSIMVKSKIE